MYTAAIGAEKKPMGGVGADIPKFDLAEEIMARQRMITAGRRKGPFQISAAETAKSRASRAGLSARWQLLAQPVGRGIISEIVARDIAQKRRQDPFFAAKKGS
jgi:hypothetical protein